ncbi:molybdenum cofactor guanylyltransferase [Paenibacillus alginolyticus]|uniref:Probable molybdenum cofactor guanylyltransferase n=1 Tax=Paenibacillus alginolyticus TaxID=59839 RepID=A0ABT4GEC5_9BACL|nr:molybdenum cofactor guanylyltransferase [Paenibacillus alginolyticus]MCY9694464.1 molybdenum cofactor guanylyltransferase [Paenibacillus alginolyticus]MEC0142050.1 molybdenum cofactor guanylyltransferase [Paenibacillus alginolyticus]
MVMLTGVILAGGANRRMNGELKALLPFGGQPLIVRQVDRMRILCDEIIVVTNEPKAFLPILDRSVRIITDFHTGYGPLGGMHAGLSLAKHSSAWVVGCDMPIISYKAAELLWNRKREGEGIEAVVPLVSGNLVPLHGIYDRECKTKILPLLKKGETRVSALLGHIFWSELGDEYLQKNGVDLKFIASIKTMDDYKAFQNTVKMGM